MIEIVVKSLADIVGPTPERFDLHGSSSSTYSVIRQRKSSPIKAPLLQVSSMDCPAIQNFSLPEIAVASFRDAIITHTGAVIVGDKYLIEETQEGDFKSNGIEEKDGRLFFDEANCVYHNGCMIDFCKLGVFNHSIFLAEMSAPAAVLSMIPGVNENPCYMHFPDFMSEGAIRNRYTALDALGFKREAVFTTKNQGTRVSNLIISKVNDRYKNHRISQALPIVSSIFRNLYSDNLMGRPQRFYIHRRGKVVRKVSNFEDFSVLLEKNGIIPVALEDITFEEQINLFSKADLVVAEHGAGLANCIFMRPGATIVEIFPEPMVGRWMYRAIANTFHLNYCYAAFPVPSNWVWNRDDIELPIGLVRHMLRFIPN